MSSVNQWIIIKIDFHTAVTASVWNQGTLSGRSWTQVLPMAVCLVVMAVVLVGHGPQLPVLQMGDDAAGALGVRPERARLAYLVVGVGLVALGCAAAGPISFVALAAPQIARRLTASPGVGLVPSAAMGAVLLLVSDVIAQQLLQRHRTPGRCGDRVAGWPYWSTCLIAQARQR